jgi:AraC-like DNA-binding protein
MLSVWPKYGSWPAVLACLCHYRLDARIGTVELIQTYTTQRLIILVENTKLDFAEIADKLHFSSPSFFSRYVRKVLDVSPGEYRQRLGDDGLN